MLIMMASFWEPSRIDVEAMRDRGEIVLPACSDSFAMGVGLCEDHCARFGKTLRCLCAPPGVEKV